MRSDGFSRHFYASNGVKQVWFERLYQSTINEYSWKFSPHFKGSEKYDTKGRTLKNALFFSKSVMDNNAQLRHLNEYFRENIFVSPNITEDNHTFEMMETPEGKQQVLTFLRAADLGIDDISVETRELSLKEIPEELRRHIKEKSIVTFETTSLHKIPGTNEFVRFDFNDSESTGTNKMFQLSGPILKTLTRGGVLFIDELERSLHCKLLSFLIDIFNNKDINRNDAQLIFTTHAPTVMDNNFLRRDQIWFTDKTSLKNTVLYSLADVAKYVKGAKPVRKGQDLSKAYLEGRFYTPPKLTKQLSLFGDD